MGKQVNFFMAKEDEEQFLDFLKETGRVVVFPERRQSREFAPLNKLPEISWPPSRRQIRFCLFNYDSSNKFVTEASSDQNNFSIDKYQSSVIEYWRCFRNGKLMYYGRIWAEMKLPDRERRVFSDKEPAFLKWYEKIASWFKHQYKHVTVPGPGLKRVVYLSPNVVTFEEEGGMLCLNPPIRGKERESVLDRE